MGLDELVSQVESQGLDLATWARDLDWHQAARLESAVEVALRVLPVPIGPLVDSPLVRRRRALERINGRLKARRGDMDALVSAERLLWLRGGGHLAYLQVLQEAGRPGEAASLARTLLARESDDGRDALEGFLAGLSHPPEGWASAVGVFAEAPSLERWRELWRFTPADVLGERRRYTLQLLLRLGVDHDTVFACAADEGPTADAVDLAEQGLVAPRVIEARSAGSDHPSTWLGLAARSACVRGDRLGTVRLLRRALHHAEDGEQNADVEFVWDEADSELRYMMEKAGIHGSDS